MNILVSGIDLTVINNITSVVKAIDSDCRVSAVNSGWECLDVLKNINYPDVIIVSTKLVDMSGFELIEYIRDDSDIPIIFISDDNDIKNLVRAFDAGADDYVVFPLNKVVFMVRLKALIRRNQRDIQMHDNGLKTGVRLYLRPEKMDFKNICIGLDPKYSYIFPHVLINFS